MGLKDYRAKRRFQKTPEPTGGELVETGGRLFVVQKHAARRLHYDFRLEHDGALKSWAVPKGPSMSPRDKRLAVQVEDHPLAYGAFEGEIPPGQYGAGSVRLWDRGRWEPEGDVAQGLRAGKLVFRLFGRKLRGRFALIALKGPAGGGGKNWLLIKERDRPALKPARLRGSKPAPLPDFVAPQLCTLVDAPPSGEGWLHEVKLDGYRLLGRLEQGRARLLTRRANDWSAHFPTVKEALERLGAASAWIDGEVVALDERGRPRFQALQNALSGSGEKNLVYYAFDLLYLDGHDLRGCPLLARKSALAALLAGKPDPLRYVDHIEGRGPEFFAQACRAGLEGVVSKSRESRYVSARTRQWLKVKCLQRQEFVIVGYTAPKGSRAGFGALLLGLHEDGRLRYAGRAGTGFDERTLRSLHERLSRLRIKAPPVANAPRARDAHWIRPELVAEVAFSEWTKDGVIRQPVFLGLRADKPAQEIVPETARPQAAPLTHPERVLYPRQGSTKRGLADYYEAVADRMLAHVARRPLSLLRCPSGQGGECFFQKHVGKTFPSAVKRVPIEEKGESRVYSYIEDLAGLLGLVQMGVLEIHPWSSTIDALERPDVMIFDLDPAPDVAWSEVVDAAKRLRARLRSLRLESFVKTTGGKGLHVVVPVAPDTGWDDFKAFSKAVALGLAQEEPRRYTATMAKAARAGKIFVDYLRNGRGATAIAPYSTRARPQATIAVPISWEELSARLDPASFTIATVPAKLARQRTDPWAGFVQTRQSLAGLIKKARA